MSFSLSDAMTRLNSLQFNAQEKGQLKAQLMKLNSEQLQFLFEDGEEVVTASLTYLLGGRFLFNFTFFFLHFHFHFHFLTICK